MSRLGPFFPGGSAYGDLRSLQGLGDAQLSGDFCSSPCPPNCPDDYDPSACSPVNASVCQPATNDYTEMYGTPQCVAALGPIVPSENPLGAALVEKINPLTGPPYELQSDPGWANVFAQLGITQQEALCYMSMMRCYYPGVAAWLASQGYTEASQPPASPATNYAPPATNATSAYVSGSQVIATQTGQPVTSAAAPPIVSTSTPGASPGSAPATSTSATSACAFALFGETSCIGPVGTTTALVIGGALLALFLLMGGKR